MVLCLLAHGRYVHATDGGPSPAGTSVAGPVEGTGEPAGRKSQFAQLHVLCDVGLCQVGVMPFAMKMSFHVPTDPEGKKEVKIVAAESLQDIQR